MPPVFSGNITKGKKRLNYKSAHILLYTAFALSLPALQQPADLNKNTYVRVRKYTQWNIFRI